MAINDKQLEQIIRETLGLGNDTEKLDEAFVLQAKKYDLTTDLLSQKTNNAHQELLNGYVETANNISAKLDSVDKTSANANDSAFRSLKCEETYNVNSAFLHAYYFENIADPTSKITMDSLVYMRLTRDFGTFDDWQRDFIACAMSSRCGWVVTYLNMYTQTYMNCFVDLHSKNVPVGMYPVIVIDMWQHAYYRDYLKDSKTYLTAMMKQLRWSKIEKRFKKADKIINIIRGL